MKEEFKITVPVKLGKDDVIQLTQELENTDSSFLTEFLESLLKKTAEIGCSTETGVSCINAVNPFGFELHSQAEVNGLEVR